MVFAKVSPAKILYHQSVGRFFFNFDFFRLAATLVLISPFSSFASRFEGGAPGCFETIRNRVLSSGEVMRLPEFCQKLRLDYVSLLDGSLSPARVRKSLEKALLNQASRVSPYEAILFALLMKDRALIPVLKKRALADARSGVPFRYAELALERMEGRAVETLRLKYKHPNYAELLRSKDSILELKGGRR